MRIAPFNPYIAVIIGVIAMSSASLLVKLTGNAPSGIIANYRLLFAVIPMTPFILIRYRHEFKLIQYKDWITMAFSGIFLALYFVFWFESLSYTSVASSVVLLALQPAFSFIATYFFFKDRFSFGTIVSLVIALFGTFIIMSGDFGLSKDALYGDVLAVLGAIFLTIYFLLGQRLRKRVSFMTYTFTAYSASTIALFIYNIARQQSFTGYMPQQWLVFLALALIPTFLGHLLFNWALKWTNSSTVSFGSILVPIVATFLAYLFLNEQVTASQLLGGTIVLFGLFLFSVSTNRKRYVTISTDIPKKQE